MSSQTIRVAGVSFRQDEVAKCMIGCRVTFEHEPDNPYDQHAYKVLVKVPEHNVPVHVGYVPKDQAIDVKNAILADNFKGAELSAVGGPSPSSPIGLQIRLDFDGKPPKILF